MEAFGKRLRRARRLAKKTIAEVSEGSGIPAPVLVSWEQYKRKPNMENLLKLCYYFGIDPNEFTGWEEYLQWRESGSPDEEEDDEDEAEIIEYEVGRELDGLEYY